MKENTQEIPQVYPMQCVTRIDKDGNVCARTYTFVDGKLAEKSDEYIVPIKGENNQ